MVAKSRPVRLIPTDGTRNWSSKQLSLGATFKLFILLSLNRLKGKWARLEFKVSMEVLFFGFIQLQDSIAIELLLLSVFHKLYSIVDLPLLVNRLLGCFVDM